MNLAVEGQAVTRDHRIERRDLVGCAASPLEQVKLGLMQLELSDYRIP